jgi:DNA gyrase subunit A
MPIDTFREQRRGGLGVSGLQFRKEDESVKSLVVAETHDTLLLFTTLGRCYWLKVWQIPEASRKSKGRPLINLLEDLKEGESIAAFLPISSFESKEQIFMTTRQGVVKKCDLSQFSNPRRKGIIALDLDEGDEVVATRLVEADHQVMIFTRNGMAVRFLNSDVRTMGRTARGVKGVTLRGEGDRVISSEVVKGTETVLIVCENGFGKRSLVDEFRQTHRGGVGVKSIITSERNGRVVAALCVQDTDSLLLISAQGQTVRIGMKELRVLGRSTQGVKLVNLREDDTVVAVEKLDGAQIIEEQEDANHL